MFHSRRNTSGFTLIELLVVITIIGILFAGSYVPYDYYSRLSQVRRTAEKIHQSMEDARILAQNGQLFPGSQKNANTSILLEKDSHTIKMFASIPGTHPFSESPTAQIIKTITLEEGVNITGLPNDKMLVEYTAPHGEMEIYTSPTQTGASFLIDIGWRTALEGPLHKSIKIEK